MPFKPGDPKPANSGRKKGQAAEYRSVREKFAAAGFDPFLILRKIAEGDLPCGACQGAGKTKYQPARGGGKTFDRTCESCYGSGKERIDPATRARAASESAKYCEPQLKQVEVQGPGGGPIQSRHELIAVRPGEVPPDLK